MIVRTLGLAAVAVLMTMASVAHAQSTVVDAVFSEVEKRIIRDYYGVGSAQQNNNDRSAPDWAVHDQEEQDDDNKGDKKKGEHDKGDKKKGDKDKSKGLPPGLAKRDQLPPGLAKQLKEKGRLPPGLAKRDLPADLASRLPSRPGDQDVTVVDSDVVLIDKATGIILDILKDVANNGAGNASTLPNGTLATPPSQDETTQDTWVGSVLKSIFGSGN